MTQLASMQPIYRYGIIPTPVGCVVRAVATYLGPEGKMHRFRVEAFDQAGAIGEGEHARAVITTERLLTGAARRKG